jgi:hypothetical protein
MHHEDFTPQIFHPKKMRTQRQRLIVDLKSPPPDVDVDV